MARHNEQLLALLAMDLDRYFPQFVVEYQQRLAAFVLRQSGNMQDTEDIAQETFLRAYHALANYPAERICALKPHPWLCTIALHIFYRHVNKVRLDLVELDLSEEGTLLDIEDDSGERPEEILEDAERLQELVTLVSTLPSPYREMVNFYYFEDLNYREIAELLKQPVGTVKSTIFRGTKLLRKTLEMQNQK